MRLYGLCNPRGLTILELAISGALLLIALGGILVLYITGDRLLRSGIENMDIQRHTQVLCERIIRAIRPASTVTISENGDAITFIVPEDISGNTVNAKLWLSGSHLFYDPDTDDGVPGEEIINGIYKLNGTHLFSLSPDGTTIYVSFGIRSGYLYGNIRPIEISFGVSVRNQGY